MYNEHDNNKNHSKETLKSYKFQDVHRRIHEAKKLAPPRDVSRWDTYQPFDPVPPVGDTIIQESWIICLDEFQVGVPR